MKSLSFLLSIATATLIVACNPQKETIVSNYPSTQKVDTVDTYFGQTVNDPYRWLENDTTKETGEWVKAQNDVTFGYLNNIPYRSRVLSRLEELNNYEKLGTPFKKGEYYYYFRNEGLQNHFVLYRKKGENGTPEVFLDPNTWSADGTKGLNGLNFTNDGSLLTYLVSEGGSDWRKAVTIRTSDKSMVEDTIPKLKFTGISWKGNEGFYYSRFDIPDGNILFAKLGYSTLYYHKIGTPIAQDQMIISGKDMNPQQRVGGYLTEDERFLVISSSVNTSKNTLHVKDLSNAKSKIVPIVTDLENTHFVIDNDGSRLLIQTNLNAPNNRVVETSLENPGPSTWKDVIPETENVLATNTAGGKIFAFYTVDVKSQIKQFDYTGKFEREVQLPGIGSAGGFNGELGDKEVFYNFTSFTYPNTIFKYDIASGKSSEYIRPKVAFNPEDYEVKQVFYASKDGTKIPMFIVHKKGVELNGKNPTWLYAYGGFNISVSPNFSASRMVWLENGGVYAQPSLRGGGEYGEKWHEAGTKLKKQNVFDDFIAAGEYLINEKYTSQPYLAINGGSNGGLLVGATMTQRPDLAKVAIPQVGVMDMLRYHKFTIGAAWAGDYGRSDDSQEMFEYLKKYSPLHALKPGTSYPATMVTTADHDDRVVPAHSFKFAAALQENHIGTNPVLIRIDTKSGHGASNLKKSLETVADMYSFAWYNMNVVPPVAKDAM
jgi:prolyl oligopeptidase